MNVEILTDIKKYLSFLDVVYKNDSHFKNNKAGIMPIVCGEGRPYYNHSFQRMIAIKEKGKILCQAVLIRHKAQPEILMISFFEALPDSQKAVDFLIDYAMDIGKRLECKKMIVSLDGHCNNSVAFSRSNQSFPSFGESYNPQYYLSYFKGFDEVSFSSFCDSIHHVKDAVKKDMAKISSLLNVFTFEHADFSKTGFKKTMGIYTDLNNEIFNGQRYYFNRQYDEDMDLFREMKPLLNPENLIFAKKEGKYVGFILWYPDFNELTPRGKGVGILEFIKYRLLGRFPKKVKVVEIGVIRKYRRYGTIITLFNEAINVVLKKYKNSEKIISSWILDENEGSKMITKRYTKLPYKEFIAYEKEI